MMGKYIIQASGKEVKDEAKRLKVICFIIKKDVSRLKKLLGNLKNLSI